MATIPGVMVTLYTAGRQVDNRGMHAKRRSSKSQSSARPQGRSSSQVTVRKRRDAPGYEFVHPRCAVDRADDLEEVRKMIEHEETEVAQDELRWLLGGCSDMIEAHKMLGELALAEGDLPLARGHFGYAFQIGERALKAAGWVSPLPYEAAANQTFHEAGKGLAYCLKQLGKLELLGGVIGTLTKCDPTDPLGVRGFLTEQTKDG